MKKKVVLIALRSVGLLLFVTAVVKLISVTQETGFLEAQAPLLSFLSNRQLLFVAALLELSVVGYRFFGRDLARSAGLTAWLATVFLVYRVGLWWMSYEGPCSCLGGAADWVPLLREYHEIVTLVIFVYLCVVAYGSAGLLLGTRFRKAPLVSQPD